MNRLSAISLAAALAAFSAGTMAADPQSPSAGADKTQVAPGQEQMQQGAAPSVQTLDNNAQRQHDKDQAAGQQGQAGSSQSASSDSQAGSGAAGSGTSDAGGTRDWAKVDSNSDGVIQPEEMEAFLSQGSKK